MASRYIDIKIETGSVVTDPKYYRNVIYPEIPPSIEDTYVIASSYDRLDILASDYYGDSSLWWIISSANNLPGNSLYLTNGTQVRIPADFREVLNQFTAINTLR
jgi:hypothetical protein